MALDSLLFVTTAFSARGKEVEIPSHRHQIWEWHHSPILTSSYRCTSAPKVSCSLNAREFLRVGNETNRLNMPFLHLNGQDEQGLITSTEDQSRLTIDFSHLYTVVLWQKAFRSHAKARHRITPANRTQRRSFDLATAISPQRHLFSQQVLYFGHLPGLNRLEYPLSSSRWVSGEAGKRGRCSFKCCFARLNERRQAASLLPSILAISAKAYSKTSRSRKTARSKGWSCSSRTRNASEIDSSMSTRSAGSPDAEVVVVRIGSGNQGPTYTSLFLRASWS